MSLDLDFGDPSCVFFRLMWVDGWIDRCRSMMWKQLLSKFPGKTSSDPVSPSSGSDDNEEGAFSSEDVYSIEAEQEKRDLFIEKLNLCSVVFDFSDFSSNLVEKDVKRQSLGELLEYIASADSKFSDAQIDGMCMMFAANLFRPFPPNCHSSLSSPSFNADNFDDDPVFDPCWPHLQLVYELLLKFITSPWLDVKVAKDYMDHTFILKLLNLFDSDDPRERDCLKSVLHRFYGKFMTHRSFIRKSVSNIFHTFVIETQSHNGISELLEVFGSVIIGFALPLKEEHKFFLLKVLIPLHKPKSAPAYLQQLTFCVMQFIDKEPNLVSTTVIPGLLRCWPLTNPQKEVMFLSELEEIMESIDTFEFQKIMIPMFRRIACCINSSHFQVPKDLFFLCLMVI